jgi:hypothetical protein
VLPDCQTSDGDGLLLFPAVRLAETAASLLVGAFLFVVGAWAWVEAGCCQAADLAVFGAAAPWAFVLGFFSGRQLLTGGWRLFVWLSFTGRPALFLLCPPGEGSC